MYLADNLEDLIDLDMKPPPEYTPPVPPHDLNELSAPSFVSTSSQDVYELSANQSSTPRCWETYEGIEQDVGHENDLENEDPEVAFYRELRQQEEERRERLAARANNG